MFDEKLGSMFV